MALQKALLMVGLHQQQTDLVFEAYDPLLQVHAERLVLDPQQRVPLSDALSDLLPVCVVFFRHPQEPIVVSSAFVERLIVGLVLHPEGCADCDDHRHRACSPMACMPQLDAVLHALGRWLREQLHWGAGDGVPHDQDDLYLCVRQDCQVADPCPSIRDQLVEGFHDRSCVRTCQLPDRQIVSQLDSDSLRMDRGLGQRLHEHFSSSALQTELL